MRLLPLAAACAAAVLLSSGCAAADKAQSCAEATQVVSQTISAIGKAVDDPAAMRQKIEDGVTDLENMANKAADTTLRDALQGLADSLQKLNVDDANAAVDAAQKVATDGANYLSKVSEACL
ncbi:hypothetical protein GCM10010116_37600 [Microbispora rosea subsp. aerata]|nr:hypothetical protein [Microbispora rosea]GGO18690.1 hypothetical protein GCM10010116_37600 [Microbispora rosea subsp. aerata]GIH54343.1 hypothetical protein Mro02_12570 [Microbispora rosea subsp. aerata]GLJ81313.1 hypothetical protein GCM10017588_00360 [Microbispora rosea subsp. aerata]